MRFTELILRPFKQLNWMISLQDRAFLHQFLILELAIRSLQRDFSQLENLKLQVIYKSFTEQLLKQLYPMYYSQKQTLAKKRIRVIRWRKIDEYFSEVCIATAGENLTLQYANKAVKAEVEQFLQAIISREG